MVDLIEKLEAVISIHSLRMEGDPLQDYPCTCGSISIHSLRMEGDKRRMRQFGCHFLFQSTPSAWRETAGGFAFVLYPSFQSTPSAWRETYTGTYYVTDIAISIHSLRMEGDSFLDQIHTADLYFNPLPPHGGRRLEPHQAGRSRSISIHSLRMEGDRICVLFSTLYFYFNPLPPHGGRHREKKTKRNATIISIHSLRMEGDRLYILIEHPPLEFQSTPSAWRETGAVQRLDP